jgi:hypothetical protein
VDAAAGARTLASLSSGESRETNRDTRDTRHITHASLSDTDIVSHTFISGLPIQTTVRD